MTNLDTVAASAGPDELCDVEIDAWLRLASAELPPRRLSRLLDAAGGCAAAVLDGGPGRWHAHGLSGPQIARLCEWRAAELSALRTAMDRFAITIVRRADDRYPARLRELPDAPPVLFARGRLLRDDQFSVAVVGSRRAGSYGLAIAERFARELASHGLCIVSGGARGIDTRAHRGALARGRTLAVVGCGLDYCYPAENRRLFDEMVSSGRGAVLSEFAPRTLPEPWRFPARNRLISGMTLGTLVVESPLDSGAMITASRAADQGRDVFAVPGPIETGRSAGCHRLIQDGAKLVQSATDVLEELGVLRAGARDPAQTCLLPPALDLDGAQQQVLGLLGLEPQHVDALAAQSAIGTPAVAAILTVLELRGLARRLPGNVFVRIL